MDQPNGLEHTGLASRYLRKVPFFPPRFRQDVASFSRPFYFGGRHEEWEARRAAKLARYLVRASSKPPRAR